MTDQPAILPDANWNLIPPYMRRGMERWIDRGCVPGSFLQAVLRNDLSEACSRADDNNRVVLPDYMTFLVSYAPAGCFGSPENVKEWAADGGLQGLSKNGETA